MVVVRKKSRKIAFVGIFASLSIILLFVASTIPSGKIALLVLSALPTAILLITFDYKYARTNYIVTSILSIILIPNKSISLLYIFLFGNYGLVKYFIEIKSNLILEYICKAIYFNIVFISYYFFAKQLILVDGLLIEEIKFFVIVSAQILWIVFDWIYALLIIESLKLIKKVLK